MNFLLRTDLEAGVEYMSYNSSTWEAKTGGYGY